ncbi:MAG: B12-binding domain-containing radical SAM protein [Promethearchaeota archaeon]
MSKKITFVNLSGPDFFSKYIPPLGLCSLASYLIHKVGIPEDQLGFVEDYLFEADSAARAVIDTEPEFVGVGTIAAMQILPSMYMMKLIKEELPDTPIIVGGAHGAAIAESFLTHAPWLDMVVIGEGEIPITEILKTGSGSDAESKWAEIPNLVFRRKSGKPENGEIITTKQQWLVPDMTDLRAYYPEQNLEFHDTRFDPKLDFSGKGLHIPMESSRGCPYNCHFCMVPKMFGRKYRVRPVKAIIRDIKDMEARFGQEAMDEPLRYVFWDANFGMNPSWRAEWIQSAKKLDHKIEWECETRIDRMGPKVMRHYVETGLVQAMVGLESASKRVREKLHNKKINMNRLVQAMSETKDSLHYIISFILGAPSETLEEIRESIEFARYLSQEVGLCPPEHEFPVFIYHLYPDTYISDHIDDYISQGARMLLKDKWWLDPTRLGWFSTQIEPNYGISADVLEEALKEFYERVYGSGFYDIRAAAEKRLEKEYKSTYERYARAILTSLS